jgi:hypothetical protein
MKRVRLLGLALMAVFTLGAVAAATASATEAGLLYLEGEKGEVTFTGEGPPGKLIGAAGTMECTKTSILGGVFTGTEKHVKAGTIKDIHFTGCKFTKGTTKVACNSEGDEKEVVLLPKNTPFTQFNGLEASKKLSPGIGVTVAEFTIKCGAVANLIVKGTALGTVVAALAPTDITEAELKFAGNKVITCDPEESDTLQKFCKEKKEAANELLVNATGVFETANLETAPKVVVNKMMLLDD